MDRKQIDQEHWQQEREEREKEAERERHEKEQSERTSDVPTGGTGPRSPAVESDDKE